MSPFIKYSLLNNRTNNEKLNQELADYRLSLIRDILENTRFSEIIECQDQSDDVLYSCSDRYKKMGNICIWEDKKSQVFMLSLDDSVYDHADLLIMDNIGLSMDQFCQRQHKSLEDLVEHLAKIIFCLPTR